MTFPRILLLLPLLGMACQGTEASKSDAQPWPQWRTRSVQYRGTPLAGPDAEIGRSPDRTQAWTFAMEFLPLGSSGPLPGQPLVERTAWALDPGQADPLLATARAAESTHWLEGEDAARWRGQAAPAPSSKGHGIQVALAPGQTFAWTATPAPTHPTSLTAFVSRPNGSARGATLTLAFTLPDRTQEIVEFDGAWRPDQGPFVLLWNPPAPAQVEGRARVALYLSPWQPQRDSAEFSEALARSDSSGPALPGPFQLPTESTRSISRPQTQEANGTRMRACTRAGALGAVCSTDWLLHCDAESAVRWLEASKDLEFAAELPESAVRKGVLRLERMCLTEAVQGLASDPDSPVALAFLLRQTGQLARHPDELLESIRHCQTPQALQGSLAMANLNFLDHAEPSARLRAYEWLLARGLAPSGFDPLERSSQRKRALELWQSETQAPPLAERSAP